MGVQYTFYSCTEDQPGFSPLDPAVTYPFGNNVPVLISPGNLLYVVVHVQGPATSTTAPPVRGYTMVITHNCDLT